MARSRCLVYPRDAKCYVHRCSVVLSSTAYSSPLSPRRGHLPRPPPAPPAPRPSPGEPADAANNAVAIGETTRARHGGQVSPVLSYRLLFLGTRRAPNLYRHNSYNVLPKITRGAPCFCSCVDLTWRPNNCMFWVVQEKASAEHCRTIIRAIIQL